MNSLNPIADLPMGLGMALAQNVDAMEQFASLSPDEQRHHRPDPHHQLQERDAVLCPAPDQPVRPVEGIPLPKRQGDSLYRSKEAPRGFFRGQAA